MEKQLLKELSLIPAMSGHEDGMIRFVKEWLAPYCDTVHVDRLGNVSATFPGTEGGASIAYFAHMDELGLIVRRVEEDGFLRIERVGGVPEKTLPSIYVDVHTLDGAASFPAVVGVTSHHTTPPDKKFAVTPTSELYIDMGLGSRQAVEALGVSVGSAITYRTPFEQVGELLAGKSMDDRIGVYSLLMLARHLHENPPRACVHLIFSVEEEFSVRACTPCFTRLNPDAAVCLDIAPSCDTPELRGRYEMVLHKGPALTYMNFHGRGTLGGLLPNPKLNRFFEQIARENGIPFQREVVLGVVTDDAFTQYCGTEGIPMAHLSLPIRYTHAPIELIDPDDLGAMVDWVCRSAVAYHAGLDLSRG